MRVPLKLKNCVFVKNEFSVSVLSEEEPVGKRKDGVKNKILEIKLTYYHEEQMIFPVVTLQTGTVDLPSMKGLA